MTPITAAAIGTLVISFDTELIWGSFDHMSDVAFERRFPDERGTIRALLEVLCRYEIAATWAVVGHLFLGSCRRGPTGRAHPELVHPMQSWVPGAWLDQDPCSDVRRHPHWYGEDILDAIQAASTPQEIGCHSFTHPLFNDVEMSVEAARSDIRACLRVARTRGIELRSFVFPRNRGAHHQVLRDAGFTAYRGPDPTWHAALPGPLVRVGHLVDQALGVAPPTTAPSERLPGLWNIPGSMMLMDRHGLRRVITRRARLDKALRGLRRAATKGTVFHLWTHPFNVAADRDALIADLDALLTEAVRLREAGVLRIEPMATVAARLAAGHAIRQIVSHPA